MAEPPFDGFGLEVVHLTPLVMIAMNLQVACI